MIARWPYWLFIAALIFIAFIIAMCSSHKAHAAVDCEMARSFAASMSKEQLASMGTKEQRAQYAHCFKKPKKKARKR